MSEPSHQVIEPCIACGQPLDVSDLPPFSEIDCPHCNATQRVRKMFQHFELVELLGEGGMGSVFKAKDLNLQREVALKILKRSASSTAEDYRKLEEEARITASINHPYVVKVFSFGEDQGLFFLAMELVPHGSLDDLMGLQGRVGELQVLNVGIQVAQGLQAALDRNLLHRDVKPGNILFADATTSKIVDFGLAVILDEQAQEQGEIWGTPYYIAPEKLDNRPEDFRSDIYSLGGTLFHALAGRPPFEASTASMVALKHIKSQAVSLQAFAPDVSSETAYVINRMLNKDPDDRYASYDELVGHLTYAKQKLEERAKAPRIKKDRGIIESDKSRTMTAVISGVTLLILVAAGVMAFVFRDTILPGLTDSSSAPAFTTRELDRAMQAGQNAFAEGRFAEAVTQFRIVSENTQKQPFLNWALANLGLALLVDGNGMESVEVFASLQSRGLYSTDSRDQRLANFFVEMGRLMSGSAPISGGTIRVYDKGNYDAFAMLAYAMKDWNMGEIASASELLGAFDQSNAAAPYEWINSYKPAFQSYLLDAKEFRRLQKKAASATAATKAEISAEIQSASENSRSGTQVQAAYRSLLDQLNTRQ